MNVFEQLGCREDREYKGLYYHDMLPFEMSDNDGFLRLEIHLEYLVSDKKIPLTKDNLQRLINSFNPDGYLADVRESALTWWKRVPVQAWSIPGDNKSFLAQNYYQKGWRRLTDAEIEKMYKERHSL
jgi:hypothetical protein